MSIFEDVFPNPASNTITGDVSISGDLNVSGDINASGEINLTDALILLNEGETGAGITPGPYGGIEIDRGTLTNYQIVFDETDDTFKVGLAGALVPVQFGAAGAAGEVAFGASSGDRLTSDSGFTFDSLTTGLSLSGASSPSFSIEDTTNNVIGAIASTDTVVEIGSTSAHNVELKTNDITRASIGSTGDFTIINDLYVTGNILLGSNEWSFEDSSATLLTIDSAGSSNSIALRDSADATLGTITGTSTGLDLSSTAGLITTDGNIEVGDETNTDNPTITLKGESGTGTQNVISFWSQGSEQFTIENSSFPNTGLQLYNTSGQGLRVLPSGGVEIEAGTSAGLTVEPSGSANYDNVELIAPASPRDDRYFLEFKDNAGTTVGGFIHDVSLFSWTGDVDFSSATASTNSANGALILSNGGLGVAGQVSLASNIVFDSTAPINIGGNGSASVCSFAASMSIGNGSSNLLTESIVIGDGAEGRLYGGAGTSGRDVVIGNGAFSYGTNNTTQGNVVVGYKAGPTGASTKSYTLVGFRSEGGFYATAVGDSSKSKGAGFAGGYNAGSDTYDEGVWLGAGAQPDRNQLFQIGGSSGAIKTDISAVRFMDGTQTITYENPSVFSDDLEIDGDLGLGITPTEKLHVNGNALIEGSISADNYSGKNLIHNGDMIIAQRNTTFTLTGTGTPTLDRWVASEVSSATIVITQDSDTPTVSEAGGYLGNSLDIDLTAADATVAAGDYFDVYQWIEGYNFRDIYQQSFTISFWAKSNKTGTYCVSLTNSGVDRSYVAEYTIDTADTWEKKTITVTLAPSGGTWNFTNSKGLGVRFAFMAGTTFQTTAGAWQTGDYLATSSQTNLLDSTSNYFRLTGVQVEAGELASPFNFSSVEETLVDCQRYYTKSYAIGNFGGDIGNVGVRSVFGAATTTPIGFTIQYPRMRTTPTATIYSNVTGTSGSGAMTGGDKTVTLVGLSETGFEVTATDAAGSTFLRLHYTVDAELT